MDGESWMWLALTAAASVALGFFLGRVRWRRVVPAAGASPEVADFMSVLAAEAAPLDLLPAEAAATGRADGQPSARCLLRRIDAEGLLCELGESPAEAVSPGLGLTCCFAPHRLSGRRVSAFVSRIRKVDLLSDPPRLVLAPPAELLDIPRRRHPRKRVSDQRFVRVRLWLADWRAGGVRFSETAPDLWVNAYADRRGDDNAVIDISAGGLALEVRSALAPPELKPGRPVVLKCSLFRFREKRFQPYWYGGEVRAAEPCGEGALRISVAFAAAGRPDPTGQNLVWEVLDGAKTAPPIPPRPSDF